MEIISKSTTKPGIKLIATSRSSDCDLMLAIPSSYCTNKRALNVHEYPIFDLNFKFNCKGGTYPHGLIVSFKGVTYPKDGKNSISLNKDASITVEVADQNYQGTMTVYRRGYMSSDLLGKLRKDRKDRQPKP